MERQRSSLRLLLPRSRGARGRWAICKARCRGVLCARSLPASAWAGQDVEPRRDPPVTGTPRWGTKATAEEPQPRPCGLSPARGAQAGKPWCCSPKAVGFDLFCSCRLVFHGLDELGIRALAWDVSPGWLPRPARGFLSDRDEVTLILYLGDEDCISAR